MRKARVLLLLVSLLGGLWVQPADADIKGATGCESGAPQNDVLSAAGTVAASTSNVHSGVYSCAVTPTAGNPGYIDVASLVDEARWIHGVLSLADGWVQFRWVYTQDVVGTEHFAACIAGGSTYKLDVRLKTTGSGTAVLEVYDSAAAFVATGATTLNKNSSYRIRVRCSTSASPSAYEVMINGVTELSGTASQTNTNISKFRLGRDVDLGTTELLGYYFDDAIVTDAAFDSEIEIWRGVPTGSGATMQWSAATSTGTCNATPTTCWDELEEIPIDDASFIASSGSANQTAEFEITNSSSISASIATASTIHGVISYARMAEASAVTSAEKHRIVSGSTTSAAGTAWNATTTPQAAIHFHATDPDTSSAWTPSGIDGIKVGSNEGNAVTVRMYSVAADVIFTAGVGGGGGTGPAKGSLGSLGVGR